jgi:hypothetical protein
MAGAALAQNDANPTNQPPKGSETAIAWGDPVNGLQAGLEVVPSRIEPGEPIRLSLHLRNAGTTPFRVFRGEECLHKLAASTQVTGPGDKVIKAEKGDTKASVAYRDRGEADWPILKSGESVGPLEILVLTSALQATVHDVWYDWSQLDRCEARLTYRLPLASPLGNLPAPAATRALSPPAWTGTVTTGSVPLAR